MMTQKIYRATFGLLFVLLFVACKKEVAGPKGEPGTPGGGGNSNIASTSVFPVTTSQWVVDTVANCLKVSLSFPVLTKSIVDGGGVKVYVRTGNTWTELPYVTGDLF